MLDEVTWGADGWPSINEGRGPSAVARSPYGARDSKAALGFFDDFNRPTLLPGWQWPQANVPDFRIEPARGGRLILSASGEAKGNPAAAVLARTTTTGDYVATAAVELRGMRPSETAGLSAYGDAENALGVSIKNNLDVILWRREKNEYTERVVPSAVGSVPSAATIRLRMTARAGHLYRFAVSDDGRRWNDLGGEVDGGYLPPWDRGVRVALVAGGDRGGATARFHSLRIEPSR
jgi:beta-xylosidase